mgnify:CR=1 FL=1
MSKEIEEGLNLSLDFTKLKKVAACSEDVIPAIAQCADTGDVLIVGYVPTGSRNRPARKNGDILEHIA